MAWYRRLINVLRPARLDRELDRKIQFHLRERTDDFKTHGFGDDDANLRARRQFGNPALEKERTRDMNVAGWLDAAFRGRAWPSQDL